MTELKLAITGPIEFIQVIVVAVNIDPCIIFIGTMSPSMLSKERFVIVITEDEL